MSRIYFCKMEFSLSKWNLLFQSTIFFNQFPGYHDLVPAAHAFEPKVRSDPEHFPLLTPAGMWFLHLNDIPDIKSVCHLPILLFLPDARRTHFRLSLPPSGLPARGISHHPAHSYR